MGLKESLIKIKSYIDANFLSKDQGIEHAGKFLSVGEDGNIVPAEKLEDFGYVPIYIVPGIKFEMNDVELAKQYQNDFFNYIKEIAYKTDKEKGSASFIVRSLKDIQGYIIKGDEITNEYFSLPNDANIEVTCTPTIDGDYFISLSVLCAFNPAHYYLTMLNGLVTYYTSNTFVNRSGYSDSQIGYILGIAKTSKRNVIINKSPHDLNLATLDDLNELKAEIEALKNNQ